MMGPCGVVAMLLLHAGQASPLNGTWELTRIFRAGPVPSTRAVPIDSTVYLRITLETHVGDWISGRLYRRYRGEPDRSKVEAQGVAHEPGRGARACPGRLLDLDPDDDPPFSPEWAGFDFAPIGLAPIAPVQPARDPITDVGLEGDAKVDGGVDRHGARGGDGARAEDPGQLPGAVEGGCLAGVQQEHGDHATGSHHSTNLIRPRQDHRSRADGLEGAGDQVIDVVERVRHKQPRRQGSALPAGAEIEDPGRHARIAAEDGLELDPLDAAGVAELGSYREHAPLVIGAEREHVPGSEGEH